MSYMKRFFEDRFQDLADDSGYDYEFLASQWHRVCEEAAEDGVEPDWEQFCGISMEHDW